MKSSELALEYKYRVEGHDGMLPYSLAKKATTYPTACAVHAAAAAAENEAAAAAGKEPPTPSPKPSRPGSNLCEQCTDNIRADLLVIEARWSHLTDALAASRQPRAGGERAGSSDTGRALPIDPLVSEAIRTVHTAIHTVIGQLIEDRPDVKLPADQGADELAGWLARWHVDYIADHPSSRHTVASYWDIQKAGDAVRKHIGPDVARQPIDSHCHQHIDDGTGSRLPCPGQLEGVALADGSTVVECSEDPMHHIPIEQWFLLHSRKAPRPARTRNTLMKKYARTTKG